MKRVCILHVGGTIGMALSEYGWVPAEGFVERYLHSIEAYPALPEWDLYRLDPLLDSSNMRPSDWVRIANEITRRYDAYDGFVVLHGTDTMVYTASALSYLLSGLSKPVIMTGAQLSLQDVRSDGREHILTALILATHPIPEVALYFGARLFRGNRAQKIHNHDFVAYASGNLAALARVGVRIDVRWDLVRTPGHGVPDHIAMQQDPDVIAVRVFPGMSERLMRRVLADGVDGVVLETYGTGTFPSRDVGLVNALREAIDRGVVVVNTSQCHSGRVHQELYGTGRALADIGVVSGQDMTPEAALTKLSVLLGSGASPDAVAAAISEDLAGEITPL